MATPDTAPAVKTAAFYDLDGTLLRGNVLAHYLYYARTEPTWTGRVRRLAETAIKTPMFLAVDWFDRKRFNELFYASYRGLSEDRLAVLGQELFDNALSKKVFPGAKALVEGDRRAGHVTVLVTGALDFVALPVVRYFGFDYWGATQLEYGPDGVATGRLRPPVMAGPEKVRWIRRFAAEHGIDLEASRAYADDIADLPFLSLVGIPTAVNPDLRLGVVARAHGWRVVQLEHGEGKGWRERRENAEERVEAYAQTAQRALETGADTVAKTLFGARKLVGRLTGGRGRSAHGADPSPIGDAGTD